MVLYKCCNMATGKSYECGFCGLKFDSRKTLHAHKARYHYLVYGAGNLQDSPYGEDENPFDDFPNKEAMNQVYNDNLVYILQPHELGIDNVLMFNFPIRGHVSPEQLANQMREIYRHANKAYKLELSVGLILRDTTDGSLRYFRPEANAYILENPLPVVDKESLEAGVRYLKSVDIDDLVRSFRPNTKYVVQFITQLEWHAWKTNFALGAHLNPADLPDYIRNGHSLITEFDYEGFEHCCMFVCLSHFLTYPEIRPSRNRLRVRGLLHDWYTFCRQHKIKGYDTCDPKLFKGVEWKDIPHFEDCFKINLNILELKANKTVENRLTSAERYARTMYVNVWQNHLSYISNLSLYCQKYTCSYCTRMFKTVFSLKRHQKSCGKQTSLVFPKGAYRYHKTVFEQLSEVGIVVPHNQRFFPYLICFDLEAVLSPRNIVSSSGKTVFHSVHQPVSCSIASNVVHFTQPHCIIEPDADLLVERMFHYFYEIREAIRFRTNAKWGWCLRELKRKLKLRQMKLYDIFVTNNSARQPSRLRRQPEDVAEAVADFDKRMRKFYMSDPLFNQYVRLYKAFYLYVNRVNIHSFNGQSYDIPLLSSSLIKYMLAKERTDRAALSTGSAQDDDLVYDSDDDVEDMDAEVPDGGVLEDPLDQDDMSVVKYLDEGHLQMAGKLHVIKRNNAYASLSNQHFSFLDVQNYLPAGSSYQKFVRAYATEGEKLFFPYEYLTHPSKLDDPLPPYPSDAWTSRLKGGIDILDEEYQEYLLDPGNKQKPKTGLQNYTDICNLMEENGFTSLRHLLLLYNNADCKPMISALENMQNEYFAQGLDLFKVSISCPGLARIMLMKHAQDKGILFPLIHPQDEDLFWMFKAATVGGPSIIYMRQCEVSKTRLEPDGNVTCASIEGWDANAMYTQSLRMPMMTYLYVRRFENDGFKPRYRKTFFMMYVWLNHIGKVHGRHIRTKLNTGADIKAGRFYLDGQATDPDGSLHCYEYLGCWIHRHMIGSKPCYLATNSPNPQGYEKWLEKKKYLEGVGFDVHYIWECSMHRLMKKRPELKSQVNNMKPMFLQKHREGVTTEQILDGVRDETFFGFIVCDIRVPQRLRSFMDRCPPIFSNTTLNMQDIGPVMREFAAERNMNIQNRRLLLSGMEAKEIMLSSRLVAFYLELGLEVTRIYQTISYVKSYPFTSFVEQVTKYRKEAQKNPDRAMVGEIYKLMGKY